MKHMKPAKQIIYARDVEKPQTGSLDFDSKHISHMQWKWRKPGFVELLQIDHSSGVEQKTGFHWPCFVEITLRNLKSGQLSLNWESPIKEIDMNSENDQHLVKLGGGIKYKITFFCIICPLWKHHINSPWWLWLTTGEHTDMLSQFLGFVSAVFHLVQ